MRLALSENDTLPPPPPKRGRQPVEYMGASTEKMAEWSCYLDRAIRWNSFLCHSTLNQVHLVQWITTGDIPLDAADFNTLCQNVNENTRSYKNQVLNNFQDQIEAMLEADACLKDTHGEEFMACLEKQFNAQNFLDVWYYMKDYVDVERSSEVGKWYMQSKFNECFPSRRSTPHPLTKHRRLLQPGR